MRRLAHSPNIIQNASQKDREKKGYFWVLGGRRFWGSTEDFALGVLSPEQIDVEIALKTVPGRWEGA